MWKKMKSSKSIFIVIGIVVVIVLVMVVFKEDTYLKLKNTDFIVEYGEHISTHIQDYLDLSELNETQKNTIIESAVLNFDIPNEQEKDYPAIGHYYGDISYHKETVQFNIIVKDTIAPEFKDFRNIITSYKDIKPDYASLYLVNDLSQVQISCDDQNVKYDSVGEYQAKIKAIDASNNETAQDIIVKVIEHNDSDYVKIKDYIPSIYVDLKYATTDNFTGQKIYDFSDAYLRYGTVQKLQKVQDELNEQGYSLLIWDAYRPFDAQKKLWSVVSDSMYVANPAKGPKSHNLGGTVDISIVKKNGESIPVPTQFDDFSKRADRDYSDIDNQEAIHNVKLLEKTMIKYGFRGYVSEWWDYSDTVSYEYSDFQP